MLQCNKPHFHFRRSAKSPDYSRNGWFNLTLERVCNRSREKTRCKAKTTGQAQGAGPQYCGVVVPRFSQTPLFGGPAPVAPKMNLRSRLLTWGGAFVKKQKDWIKLNLSYLVGTAVGTVAAYTNSYLARKSGVDQTTAATLVASGSQYAIGISAVCVSWFFLQKDKYANMPGKWLRDSAKIVGSTIVAQALTWAISWPMTVASIWLGASDVFAVTLQTQVFDRLIYIPLFNRFNRKRVKEMQELSQAELGKTPISDQ